MRHGNPADRIGLGTELPGRACSVDSEMNMGYGDIDIG